MLQRLLIHKAAAAAEGKGGLNMKRVYDTPNISFTFFKTVNRTNNLALAEGDASGNNAIGIGSEEMGSMSFKVKQLPK